MRARRSKRNDDGTLLISVAESIGSTLGTLAAKANAAQKVITGSHAAHSAERKTKNLMRKRKSTAGKTSRSASAKSRKTKRAKATRGRLHRAS